MQILAENNFVKITLNKELFLISVTWKEYAISFEDYQFAFNTVISYQAEKKTPIYNFLSDMREQNVVPPHYRKWFQEYVVPTSVGHGLRRGAVVTDAGVFKRYYLNHIMDTTKTIGVQLKLFKAPENALKWFELCMPEDTQTT